MRALLMLLVLLTGISGAPAQQLPTPDDIQALVDEIVDLPGEGVRIIRTRDGELLAMVGMRFVIRGGVLYDAWQSEPTELYSIGDIRRAATTIDVHALGIDVDGMRPLRMGHGEATAVVIVDPTCPYSSALLNEIAARDDLLSRYQFKVLVVPVLGAQSEQPVRLLECASDRASALQALLDRSYRNLKEAPGCDMTAAERRIAFFQALNLRGTPMMIAPNHRFVYGHPADVSGWLKSNQGG
jgi:thiol:disulfide interchange protein DsbC